MGLQVATHGVALVLGICLAWQVRDTKGGLAQHVAAALMLGGMTLGAAVLIGSVVVVPIGIVYLLVT